MQEHNGLSVKYSIRIYYVPVEVVGFEHLPEALLEIPVTND